MMQKLMMTVGLSACALACGATTLFFAGDSTLDDHKRDTNCLYRSWGTTLEPMMKEGNVVDNRAASGRSTKSFINEKRWEKLVASVKPGDFVAIAFGRNDQKCDPGPRLEKVYAATQGLYKENLRKFVAEIRAKGGVPVLMSPIVRGTFDREGKTIVEHANACGERLGDYAIAAKEVAEELKADFVDMHALTRALLEKTGKEASMSFFMISTGKAKARDGESKRDVTHPCKAGADAFAKLFLDDVKSRKLPVAALFR